MVEMDSREFVISVLGAFVSTLLASFLSYTILEGEHIPLVLASTGASAILVFTFPHSPLSRPWNLIGGQLVSAFVGISALLLIENPLISASLSVAVAMLLMQLLRCMHPPGGATAVTAAVGGPQIESLGYAYLVVPVLLNAIILLSIALAVATTRQRNPFYQDEPIRHPGF